MDDWMLWCVLTFLSDKNDLPNNGSVWNTVCHLLEFLKDFFIFNNENKMSENVPQKYNSVMYCTIADQL